MSKTSRPNVLLVTLHDTCPMFGCYGDETAATPNLDRLASEGVTFTRAYCQAPQCGPSRASFWSGTYPETNRATHNVNTESMETWERVRERYPNAVPLAQHLRQAGYVTQTIGTPTYKWWRDDPQVWTHPQSREDATPHIASDHGPLPVPGDYGDPKLVQMLADRLRAGAAEGLRPGSQSLKNRGQGPLIECADVDDSAYRDHGFTDRAIEALRGLAQGAAHDDPFFLAVGYKAAHTPSCAPRWAWDQNPLDGVPRPIPEDHTDGSHDPGRHGSSSSGHTGLTADEAYEDDDRPGRGDQTMRARQAYRANITFCDRQIGRLLDEIDRLGLKDDTIVLIFADHGLHVGERHRWGKSTLFETDCRVPLIVRVPGAGGSGVGERCDSLVELIDLYPTVCDLLGLETPDHVQGHSLVPVLERPEGPFKDAAFSSFGRRGKDEHLPSSFGQAIVTDRYRLARFRSPEGGVVHDLYDHRIDPHETRNVADEPDYRPVRDELIARLDAHLEQVTMPREAAAG